MAILNVSVVIVCNPSVEYSILASESKRSFRHFLMSVAIYKYICGSELTTIVFKTEDLPSDVKTIYSEVCALGVIYFGGGRGRIYAYYVLCTI